MLLIYVVRTQMKSIESRENFQKVTEVNPTGFHAISRLLRPPLHPRAP